MFSYEKIGFLKFVNENEVYFSVLASSSLYKMSIPELSKFYEVLNTQIGVFSSDSKNFYYAYLNTLNRLSLLTGEICKVQSFESEICLLESLNNNTLLIVSKKLFTFMSLETLEMQNHLNYESDYTAIVTDNDKTKIYIAADNFKIKVFCINPFRFLFEIGSHSYPINSLRLYNNGTYLVTTDFQHLKIWNLQKDKEKRLLNDKQIESFDLSKDEQFFIYSKNSIVSVFDIIEKNIIYSFKIGKNNCKWLYQTKDLKYLIIGTSDSFLQF